MLPREAAPEVVTGAAQGVAATAAVAPTQYPSITTLYMPVQGKDSWMPFTYTQTFADVPDQWASPGIGSIGYGDSSSKAKRKEQEKRALEERLAELAEMKMEKTMEKRGKVLVEVEVRELGNGKTEYIPRREVEKRSDATTIKMGSVMSLFGVAVVVGWLW